MKTKLISLVLIATLAALAGAEIEIEKLESSIETLLDYEYDKTGGVDLNWVESQVGLASAGDPVRSRVEDKLIESLAAAKTNDARQFLCRQLMTIGTARCVPQLASLLGDPDMSHMARYALGRIEGAEAGKALHQALGTTSGKLKAGIINTLVQAGYQPAAPDLVKLAGDRDKDVSLAAIRAAGHFARKDDVKRLWELRKSVARDMQTEVDGAILDCAARFAAAGDNASATGIYRHFFEGEFPEHLRTAGLRGLVLTAGNGTALITGAIKDDDPAMRRNAIAMMAGIKGSETTRTLIRLCDAAPPDATELIIRSLASRGDVLAAPALVGMLDSEHENVRLAALEALGDIGTPQNIPPLAKIAATGSSGERRHARASLARMRSEGVDGELGRLIGQGDSKVRLEIIRAIGQREDPASFAALLKVAATDDDGSLRREAIISMGRTGDTGDLPALVQLIVAPKDGGDRRAIERAVQVVFGKTVDRDTKAAAILAAFDKAPDDAKPTLLNLLAIPATDEGLETIQVAVKSQHADISDAAIRALSEWPTPAPIAQLQEIAANGDSESRRKQAFRGYVQLARLTQNPDQHYNRALKMAKGDDDIRLILENLHHAGTREALEIASSHMRHPELGDDAYRAAVEVLKVYCWQDRSLATDLLGKIIAGAPNDDVRNRAKETLRKMDELKNIIVTWKGTQAYSIPGIADGNRVFETVFDPEKNFDSEDVVWRIILPEIEGGGKIDLEKTYGAVDYCSAYLRTTIHSPVAREAKLDWQADDAIKGWLNGQPTKAGTIKLEKGANSFVIKVGEHGGGWSFRCDIVKPDGSPIEGLRFER